MYRVLGSLLVGVASLLLLGIPLTLREAPALPTTVFGISAVAGALIGRVLARRVEVILTIEHEACHMLAAGLCFQKPLKFVADRSEGSFTSAGSSPAFVLLAPYVSPFFAIVLEAVILPFLDGRRSLAFAFFLGLPWGFSVTRIATEIHLGQSDLRRVGLRAAVLIGVFAPVIFSGVSFLAIGGPPLFARWCQSSASLVLDLARRLVA
jgi:hypothetical protein